jgi:hypothetical protein
MSMYCGIVGIKPPDDKWKKMKAIWDSCMAADIEPPSDVYDYFGDYEPDEDGVTVSESELSNSGAIRPISEVQFSNRGYIIDVTKLPKDIKLIKVENSW